jgi:DNA-binding LacI/PurR family transcriptional regulator
MKENRASQRPVPVRLTLAEQAADCIRQGLLSNRWDGLLPSESELCRELGVSRGTLRSGLAVLFAEGLLRPGGRGGRHSIVAPAGKRKGNASALNGNMVKVLSPQPRFIIAGLTQSIFQTISEVLGRAGMHLEFEHHPGLWNLKNPNSALRKITRQPGVAGWLLYRSTQAVQQWFADSGIPAVVLGGKFPDMALPHGEFDLVAASRHAAGIFRARGHRRMVFITVERSTAGDQASAQAFLAAAAAAGAHAQVAVFDDTVAGLCHLLDGLLISKPFPTAYLVGFPNHVHATIGHLTRRGFPVPKVAAVISRMDAMLLAESIPTVARYSLNTELLGRGLARLLVKAVKPGSKKIGQCVIMPEYIDGETAGGKSAV